MVGLQCLLFRAIIPFAAWLARYNLSVFRFGQYLLVATCAAGVFRLTLFPPQSAMTVSGVLHGLAAVFISSTILRCVDMAEKHEAASETFWAIFHDSQVDEETEANPQLYLSVIALISMIYIYFEVIPLLFALATTSRVDPDDALGAAFWFGLPAAFALPMFIYGKYPPLKTHA